MDTDFELSQIKVNLITPFIQDEMQDNEEWDALIQQFRVLMDTAAGQKIVKHALDLLTLQADEHDFTQNCELVAAALALGFTPPTPFYKAICQQFPRMKNKSAIEKILIQMSKFKEAPANADRVCHHCATPCVANDRFCRHCGQSIAMATPSIPSVTTELATPILESFTSIISAMDQHTRLLKEMNCKKKKPFYSGATDEFEPDDQEEDDSTTPSVWREGICSNMECTNAIGQHNYALQQYLERSMVTICPDHSTVEVYGYPPI